MLSKNFLYGKDKLTVESVIKILDGKLDCLVGDEELLKINQSRRSIINVLKSERNTYGVNTGIGVLCSTIISKEDSRLLQENLLKSHAVGVGENVPFEISKLMLIIKVHSLCKGFSGISI